MLLDVQAARFVQIDAKCAAMTFEYGDKVRTINEGNGFVFGKLIGVGTVAGGRNEDATVRTLVDNGAI
jgi:hypothetical protein